MKVSSSLSGSIVKFYFKPDGSDRNRISELNFGMNELDVYVNLGSGVKSEDIHPDLIALCSILLCNPFVGEKLEINWPVSEYFINEVQSVLSRYRISSSSETVIEKRERGVDGFPALAFSGGADSSAALAVMPARTIPIFLMREDIRGSISKYNPDAPLEICKQLKESGYPVEIVETNLEYMRNPVGFPTDLANSIPSILLSDHLNLNSISFGTIMESGFGIGHEHYVEYGNGSHWRFFSKLFSSVGIDLSFPVIGVSEIGTAIIGQNSPVGFYNQSCIRGTWLSPCLRCWKCFRKELLAYSLGFNDEVDLLGMLDSNEVQVRLSAFPISHENVIIYSLQNIDLDEHPYLKPIADKLEMNADLEFLNYWYSPSIDFVPDEIRHSVRDSILKFMGVMGPADEAKARSWDMMPHLDSKKAKKAQSKLTSYWQDLSMRFGN